MRRKDTYTLSKSHNEAYTGQEETHLKSSYPPDAMMVDVNLRYKLRLLQCDFIFENFESRQQLLRILLE